MKYRISCIEPVCWLLFIAALSFGSTSCFEKEAIKGIVVERDGVKVVGIEEGAVKGEIGAIGSHNKTETHLNADGGSTVTTNSGSGWLVLGGVSFLLIYTGLIAYVFNIFLKRSKFMLDTVCKAVCSRGHENEVYDDVKQRINGNLLIHVRQKLGQLPIVDKP